MYSAFSRLNYKPWYAIAGFVDNAIQSFVTHEKALSAALGVPASLLVTIDVDDDRIAVTDNAAGIAGIEFPRAFVPAERPNDTTGLLEFGIGMKAAACWFAACWSVRTTALGEPVERTIRFDVPRIVEHGIENLEPDERCVPALDHYTTLVLERLHRKPTGRTVGKIRATLAGCTGASSIRAGLC